MQTEPGLYLLVTFHNLSAPFTVECEGAYIEVERENNGFEARWCGNRVTQVSQLLQQAKCVFLGFVIPLEGNLTGQH